MSRSSGSPRECGGRAEHDGVLRAACPTLMAAGVAGSSASGRVMRTTALANSSESPTSRPTMRCQTTSVRLPPTIATRTSPHAARSASRCPGRLRVPRRRTNAAVTEPRRADADSDQHHPPSVLLRRAQSPPVEKLVEAYKTIATPRGKGWSFSPTPQRGRPARDCDVAIPATRTRRHGDGDDSDARLRGSGRARNRASAL
jgi:hypothetical protein